MELPLDMVREAVVFLIALVLSIAVHEFGHAFAADKLGDRTPRLQGRVTLNPIVHADPIGTLVVPLMAVFLNTGLLLGWGRPVQVNPVAFTRKLSMKMGHLIVAAAGPAMNVLLALLITLLLGVLLATGVLNPKSDITNGISMVVRLNWILFFFNLLPVPPLDGGAVLAGLLPRGYERYMDFLNQYGFFILIGLLVTGAVNFLLWPAIQIWAFSMNLVGLRYIF